MISAILSQLRVIALEIAFFVGKTVPQKPRFCNDLHLLTRKSTMSLSRAIRDSQYIPPRPFPILKGRLQTAPAALRELWREMRPTF